MTSKFLIATQERPGAIMTLFRKNQKNTQQLTKKQKTSQSINYRNKTFSNLESSCYPVEKGTRTITRSCTRGKKKKKSNTQVFMLLVLLMSATKLAHLLFLKTQETRRLEFENEESTFLNICTICGKHCHLMLWS